ncbi:adenyl-nucleotide exchange factor sse1 [Recurvomyces mirabilis]|uniref:Adenyl-nucleotide exchange factor sse1 n=1 Tax=Recurvomyces mirabilis TaxID=574656 RepID=A0AAE0TR79_9PEZI|nr:adenyl-nucleotide exchange factor sse1 [Recurvomyces mirabilis]KAK5156280.1 adenyl-nucleotide exchange factor sse1 [Recurvomyces mirabilis]
MSVVGLDFGTQNAVIAVARNKGVDVITNEVSNRATPSLVSFGPRQRYLGEAAKTQEISNMKNTVGSLTRLAGRSINDPDVQIEQEYVSAQLVDVNGQVGAEVNYSGKKESFSATQLCGMFLTKIRQTASAELRLPVNDMVFSVPAWYTDAQRRSLLDAAEIAGVKVLRLVNETTATALGYGITKLDLPSAEEKPRRTAFIDIGHSNYTCTICEFRKGELKVVSTAWDRHFGGRNFDKAIMDHFRTEFKEKFKIDVYENPKAKVRLASAVEKLKKILSANASAPLNIESIMNDVDVRGFLKREELEELMKPLLARATGPLEQALAEAKLKPEDIDFIELVGGCTRVPSLKAAITDFFGGKTLNFTLNADEAIARGCAFSCAILSPVFRVRDFSVQDIVNYPIEFAWEKSPDIPDEDTSLTVFNKGNAMPSTKILTFYRKQTFDLEAKYAKPESLPGKMNPWIGRFSVKGVKADSKDDFMICKLKARLNLHGVLNVEQGYFVEEQEIEEPMPESKAEEKKDGDVSFSCPSVELREEVVELLVSPPELQPLRAEERAAKRSKKHPTLTSPSLQAMDTSSDVPAANGDAKPPAPKTRKVKKQVRKGDLPLSSGTASLTTEVVNSYTEREGQMVSDDKLVADTEDKKNELESEIYSMRNKMEEGYASNGYADFASEEEKDKVKAKCESLEDWLYDEGEDATKAQYIAKLDELRGSAGPIIQRFNDKRQEEEDARREVAEKAAAAKREQDAAAKKVAEEAAAKDAEAKKNAEAGSSGGEVREEEMKDAPPAAEEVKGDEMD